MGWTLFENLSPCEIRQKLRKRDLSKRQINKLRKRLCYLNKDADETIGNWTKSPAIKQACRKLYKQKRCKPVYKEDVLVGYEYDLLESVWTRIREVQRDDRKRENENHKNRAKNDAETNRKIHQVAER